MDKKIKITFKKIEEFVGWPLMKLIYAILLIVLTGCCALTSSNSTGMPNMVQMIDADELSRAIIRYTTKLKRERGLNLEDSNVYYTNCSERIRLVLSSQKIYEIREARDEIVDVVEGLLYTINQNPIIRTDLCGQYFTSDNLEIYISYESYFGEYIDPFYVGWTSLDQGLVCFYMFSLKEYYYDRWHSRIEPYTKSLLFSNAQREADIIYPPKTFNAEEPATTPLIIDSVQTRTGPR